MTITQAKVEIAKIYIAAFNRVPDSAGLDFWTQAYIGGSTLASISEGFTSSQEHANTYPSTQTNAEYVAAIYLNVFGRTGDSAGLTFWENAVNAGTLTHATLMNEMIVAATADSANTDGQKLTNKATFGVDSVDAGLNVDSATAQLANITSDSATVTTATAAISGSTTLALTTATNDIITGTSGNDTITAASGTLASTDVVTGGAGTDTLNVTYKTADMAATPTVSGVENINVTIDAFAGTTTTFDATNVTGATITLGSTKLGYNGAAGVAAAAANNVTAGTNVTTLTVAGLTTGVINAGSATTVNATAAAATDTIHATVNGNVALNTTTGTKTAITVTAASDIDYNSAASTTLTTINGASNTILSMARADVVSTHVVTNNSTGTLTLSVTDSGAFDATNFDVDSIVLEGGTTNAATVATGASITTAVIQDTLSIVGAAATATTNTATFTTSKDVTTSVTFTNIKTANIVATANITIDDLVTAKDAVLTGTADVVVSTANAENLDATGLVGKLTLSATTADSTIVGGSGNNDITTGDFATTYTGQNGNDTVTLGSTTTSAAVTTGNGTNTIDARSLTTGTLAVTGGTGVDTVRFDDSIGAATVAMDGGAGTDVILVGNGNNTTQDLDSAAATWTVQNFETIAVEDLITGGVAIAQAVTIKGTQLAGITALNIVGATTGTINDTLAFGVAANAATTDLSGLVVGNTAKTTVTVTGQSTAETIKGTNGNDVILTKGGADAIDLSQGGADKVTVASGESASTAKVSITGFNVTDATSTADTLTKMAGGAILTDTATNGAIDVKAAITGGTGSETVTVSIDNNGIATLAGADASAIDTLDEWIAVMKTSGVLTINDANLDSVVYAAFEFGGNTYVAAQSDAAAVWGTTAPVTDVIELVGVTGVTALAGTAALHTVIVA